MDDTTQITDEAPVSEPRQPSGGDAVTAGRVLTAITCAVLLIGLLVIRGTGASNAVDGDAPEITAENADTSDPSDAGEPETLQPIVLQPLPPEQPPRSASRSPSASYTRPGDVAARSSQPERGPLSR